MSTQAMKVPVQEKLRTVAFYLPQFHPIPENDAWWGPGYTEWRRVVSARPQFRGHRQPRLPGELGFYDLRLADTREAQAALAAAHSVDAFCYYHYWFSGRRLLERPFEEVLATGQPRHPFLLCWANEPWTRAWDGNTGSVLVPDDGDEADAKRFAEDLLPAFADDRYVHVGGRPLFLVYRATRLPDPKRTTDCWRSVVTAAGLPEPYLARVESFPEEHGDPSALGFDGAVEFQPDWSGIELPRTVTGVVRSELRRMRSPQTLIRRHRVISYERVVDYALAKPDAPYHRWPGVTPGWDNTARRVRKATIVHASTPRAYQQWVEEAARRALAQRSGPAPLLFVNAWNEWGEGSHLEPSLADGRAYLEAHRDGIRGAAGA